VTAEVPGPAKIMLGMLAGCCTGYAYDPLIIFIGYGAARPKGTGCVVGTAEALPALREMIPAA
jgi:hypothetical protein